MSSVLIFGTSSFSEVLAETIAQDSPEINLKGFILNDEYYTNENFSDRKVYKYSELKNYFSPNDTEILVSIGYTNMNINREKIFTLLKSDGWKIASYINPKATIRTSSIGIGNIILDAVNIGVKAQIGDGNIFYNNGILSHHSKIGNFNYFAPCVAIAGHVNIANRCFFGINCSVANGVNISDETLVGAGCYISKDTKFGEVYRAAKPLIYTDSKVISKIYLK